MKVASIHSGQDTGGQAWRITEAFRKHTDWEYRSMCQRATYINYPVDLPWRRRAAEELAEKSDVIHWHNGYGTAKALKMTHKPAVIHHHGTMYRGDPARFNAEHRKYGGIGVVSTLDLYVIGQGEVEWLPAPYDVDWLQSLRRPNTTDKIVIAHAPTARQVKSTAEFLQAFQQLQDEGYPVELELIEHRPWAECLERKSRADIFFDQTLLGYGCNALEAWGMGIPVIAGANDETLDEMERRFGHLPFYHATEDTIYDALKELVESPSLRAAYGQIGYDYMRQYHDEPVVVAQLQGLYRKVAGIEEQQAA